MIPLVMMMEFLSSQGKTLSEIIHDLFWKKYFVSGEINNEIKNIKSFLENIEKTYGLGAIKIDKTDGISIEYADWRFNLRGSNTEPVIRLNVEAKSNKLMEEKRDELLKLIRK
jgi:phosphomannomutase